MNTPTQQHDPYLSARHAWNEQFGGYIAAARNWRRVAIVALLLAVISVAGLFTGRRDYQEKPELATKPYRGLQFL